MSCCVDKFLVVQIYLYFVAKYNPIELIYALHYLEKFLLYRSVIMLWLTYFSQK